MATALFAGDWLRASGDDLLLQVRVQPRASRARLDSIDADVLRLRVGAPPVDGDANRAVLELLAAALGIARGASARSKQVRIAGAAGELGELRSRLLVALSPKA